MKQVDLTSSSNDTTSSSTIVQNATPSVQEAAVAPSTVEPKARRSLRPGGSTTKTQTKLNAGPVTMMKNDDLKYSKGTLLKLKPIHMTDRPVCVQSYTNVWITEENGSRVKVRFEDMFRHPVGYGYPKSDLKQQSSQQQNSTPNKDRRNSNGGGNSNDGERSSDKYKERENSNNSNSSRDKDNSDGGDGWKRGEKNEPLPPTPPTDKQNRRNNNSSSSSSSSSNGDRSSSKGDKTPSSASRAIKTSHLSTDPVDQLTQQVTAILNKITPQTFDKLTLQLCEIPISSTIMLDRLIGIIFEKAIFEPTFCNLYADMCSKLEKESRNWMFLKVIHNIDKNNYHWTKDMPIDSILAGPYNTCDNCMSIVKSSSVVASASLPAMKEVSFTPLLHEMVVVNGIFIKVYIGDDKKFYLSYIPFSDVTKDNISTDVFSTIEAALADAVRQNNFRRRLLFVCQEEFTAALNNAGKYGEFDEYKKSSTSLSKAMSTIERAEEEHALEDKQKNLKKRKLGNLRFIGELCKIGMIKAAIMYECFNLLLADYSKDGKVKLGWKKNPEEEYLESMCYLLRTVGYTLDNTKQSNEHAVLLEDIFSHLKSISKDKTVNSRIRFTIEEVLELRNCGWLNRRDAEGPSKIDDIHMKIAMEEASKLQLDDAANGIVNGNGNKASSSVKKVEAPVVSIKKSTDTSTVNQNMPPELVESKVRSIMEDYLMTNDVKEASTALSELPKIAIGYFILKVLHKYTECNSSDIRYNLHALLEGTAGILRGTKVDVEAALTKFEPLVNLCDYLNDLKDAPEIIGEIVSTLIRINACSLSAIKELVRYSKQILLSDDFAPPMQYIDSTYARFFDKCI